MPNGETTLERDHDAAQAAQAEIQRCREAARVVEDKLDVLRRTPLSETEVAILETELSRLSDERDRLDAAIEAMEFVAGNAEALSWDDAPAQLEANRSLVPALEEQLRRAEEALAEAEAAVETAEKEFERATAKIGRTPMVAAGRPSNNFGLRSGASRRWDPRSYRSGSRRRA